MIKKVASFLRKEYKKITSNSLSLSMQGEANILVQKTSNVRTWVEATAVYKIGGLSGVDDPHPGDRDVDSAIKDWLSIGKDQYPRTKKPSNVTRKND